MLSNIADLREMDEEQFRLVFDIVKERTKNFTKIDPDLLLENPQFLLILRCCLGLSQRELSKKLGKDEQFIRHFEAERQNFRVLSNRFLVSRFLEKEFSKIDEIDIENVLSKWKECRIARKKFFMEFPESTFKLKRIFEMTREDFIHQFNLLRQETNNFTSFNPEIIIRNPGFLTIFRVILDMNIKQFSSMINKNSRLVRKWESFEFRMMPETAREIMIIIEKLFRERNFIGNVSLRITLNNFEKFNFFDPNEIKIKKLLEFNEILFSTHSFVKGFGKKFNVDFVIPSSTNPSIIIEVTSFVSKKFGDIERRMFFVDHRFQMLKIENPNLKTIFAIRCRLDKESMVKNIIRKSIVNSDFCFVNDFEEIPEIVKSIVNV